MIKQAVLIRYNNKERSEIFKTILEKEKTSTEKSYYIYSKNILNNRLSHLKELFPDNALHAIAIKTQNEPRVLSHIVNKGFGLEAASFEEVMLAKKAGCPAEKIVFDSPVKTQEEINYCNEHFKGLLLNVNCFSELERIKKAKNLKIGIRINPLVDTGAPGIYNVSNNRSKFGIPINQKEIIIKYALAIDNVYALHVHAGSEIGKLEGHIEAIKRIYEIAEEINARQKNKIKILDIGGGFSAKMEEGIQQGLEDFVNLLESKCPNIFFNYKIITEYGRFVHAHAAFVASRVEYVLDYTEAPIALIHVGADLFPREIYSTHPPYHQISVVSPEGNLKEKGNKKYDIGGPLCFSGDFLRRDVELPEIQEKDWIIIADCGANTLSMWSGHCSREKVKLVFI